MDRQAARGPGLGRLLRRCRPDEGEGLGGDVALEEADGFTSGLSVGQASSWIVLAAGVPAQPGQGDPVERGVGLPITATVEPPAAGLAGGGLDRADTAERGVGALTAQPFRVVPGGDQQRGGAVGTDAALFQQLGCVGGDQRAEPFVQLIGLGLQRQAPGGERPQGEDHHLVNFGSRVARLRQIGAAANQGSWASPVIDSRRAGSAPTRMALSWLIALADEIVLGVDTYKDLHVAVAVDSLGRRLGDLSAGTSSAGLTQQDAGGLSSSAASESGQSNAPAATAPGSPGTYRPRMRPCGRSPGPTGGCVATGTSPIRSMP